MRDFEEEIRSIVNVIEDRRRWPLPSDQVHAIWRILNDARLLSYHAYLAQDAEE